MKRKMVIKNVLIFTTLLFILFSFLLLLVYIEKKEIKKEEPDTDGDRIIDIYDPDDDNDGMPDIWEELYNLNPKDSCDKYFDNDLDGVDNKNEFDSSTSPNDPLDFLMEIKNLIMRYGVPISENCPDENLSIHDMDWDDDGIPNDWEIKYKLDPTVQDGLEDYNENGYNNKAEYDRKTNPLVKVYSTL